MNKAKSCVMNYIYSELYNYSTSAVQQYKCDMFVKLLNVLINHMVGSI